MISKMIDFGPEKPSVCVIDAIHWLLPLIAGLFYFSSGVIWSFSIFRQQRFRQTPRAVISWPIFAIFLTYVFEPSVLSYLTLPDKTRHFMDDIVFSLCSSFGWFRLFLDFNKVYVRQALWHPLGGFSVIYLIAEALLLVSSPYSASPGAFLYATRIFRLGILLFLVSVVVISRTVPIKRRRSDEEEVPLLRDDNNCTRNDNQTYYSSLARDLNPDSLSGDSQSDPKCFKRRIAFLAPFFWPKHRPYLRYFGIWLSLVMDRIMFVLVPLQLGKITDILILNAGVFAREDIAISVVICLLGLSGVFSMARKCLWLSIENDSYLLLSTAIFDKIMALASELGVNKNSAGLYELVNRGLSARHAFRSVLFQIIPKAVDLLLGVGVLCYIFGAYMGFILVTVVFMSIWSSIEVLHQLQARKRECIDAMDKEHFVLHESMSNWQTASYSNGIPYERMRYFSAVMHHMNLSCAFFRLSDLGSVSQSFPIMVGLIGGCVLATFQVALGEKSTGSFVMLLIYWTRLGLRLQILARGIYDVALSLANIDELLRLFNRVPNVSNPNHTAATSLPFRQGIVEFNNVHFAYNGQKRALKGISFQAPAGQTVAFVGATGSGKSTIMSLILRLYDPLQGSITVDGQDIRHITLENLRGNIGLVPQDPILFHDTIMNNIMYGNLSVTEEQVYDACKAVDLHDKFKLLADGYRTIVGNGGMRLSGGELQRVAIARAIIKNSKIILLDEATSSVDSSTEALIQRNLKKLCKGRTTFIIAQRLSTVAKADKIIILRHGRVVEQGTHSSLLRANGCYHRLWSRQVKTKLPMSMIEDTGLPQQQRPAEQAAKEKSRVQDTDDLIEMEDSQSVTGIGPILMVSKVRPTASYKKITSPSTGDFKENAHDNNEFWEDYSTDAGDFLPKQSTLKPDAPEFVPSSRRAEVTEHQNVSKQDNISKPQGRSERRLVQTENISGTSDALAEEENAVEYPAKKRKRRSGNRRISSVLQQTNNGVVLAYPKKARRRKGSKRQPVLRRERTESEPICMHLVPGHYQQQ